MWVEIEEWAKENWGSIENFLEQFTKIYEDETLVVYIAKRNSGLTDLLACAKSNNCLYIDGFDHIFTSSGEL